MKDIRRNLLGVVTLSLRGGNPAQYSILNCAIQCKWAVMECNRYPRYKSDDDETLSYVEDALDCSHTFKDVFLHEPARKKEKVKANVLGTDLVRK
jgi:hypothetical protein